MRLLIVEDEQKTGDYLKQGLSEAGFQVSLVRNGLDGHHLAMTEDFDLIMLDVMLPDVSGLRIVQALRENHNHTPVLFLSARDSVDDRVKGLELGADDYLIKPFAFSEVLARVRTLLRRGQAVPQSELLQVADLQLDIAKRKASRSGAKITLSNQEFSLLELLMRRRGEVDRVLSGPRGDLQHQSLGGQARREDRQDRVPVAGGRGRGVGAGREAHPHQIQSGRSGT